MIPERIIVFYGSHGRELLNTVEELRLIQSIPLVGPQELYDHRSTFDVLFTPFVWSGANMLDYPTVHVLPDIQEEYYPQFFSDSDLQSRHIHHPLAARASTLLITISHYSKDTIVQKFQVPCTQVRVTHLGAHPTFSDASNCGVRPGAMPENVRDYLFYPAHAWRHKNHRRLLDAVYELKRSHSLEVNVIFTGHLLDGDFNRVDIHQEILDRSLQDQVFHIGTVSLDELKYLYLNARALIHPSLFEGFGIPLLEAMICGCPIIAADRTSIPEVAGDAALYFNPDDTSDIAEKIKYFLANSSENQNRVKIGKVLARKFNDRRTAQETLKILEDAYDLANVDRLKTTALSRQRSFGAPLMTAVFFFDSYLDQKVTSEINKLIAQFKNELQVIAIIPGALKLQMDKMLDGTVETIELEADLPTAIHEVSNRVRGRYVFLSNGRSVILPAFLYYLMVFEGSPETSAEMLDGDSFLSNSAGNIRDAVVPFGLDDEKRKTYCCSNLSFVIRSDAFRVAQPNTLQKSDSLSELAFRLWDLCFRKRVYKIVNIHFEENLENKHWKVVGAMVRIHRRFSANGPIESWLRIRIVRSFLYSTLLLYYSLPAWLRLPIHRGFKRVFVRTKNLD